MPWWALTHSTMPWAVASCNGLLRWCGITIILRTGKSIFLRQQQGKIAAKEAEAYVFVSFSLLPSFGLCSATLTSGSKTPPTSCAFILTDSWQPIHFVPWNMTSLHWPWIQGNLKKTLRMTKEQVCSCHDGYGMLLPGCAMRLPQWHHGHSIHQYSYFALLVGNA